MSQKKKKKGKKRKRVKKGVDVQQPSKKRRKVMVIEYPSDVDLKDLLKKGRSIDDVIEAKEISNDLYVYENGKRELRKVKKLYNMKI